MKSTDLLELPSYLHHTDEVKARIAEVRSRPVVLRLSEVGRCFEGTEGRVTALHDINFEVRKREFISVIGPSGCGKSTLIRIVAGLESTTSGSVLIDGNPVDEPGADRGMVFQSYTLFPWLTVKKNVMFGLRMKGMPKAKAERLAMEWLNLVDLAHAADQYPAQLSGGMKQRVAIARAMAMEPEVLLMDEPFAALDALTRHKMQDELMELWEGTHFTVLFVTHSIPEAIRVGNRILLLSPHPGQVKGELNSDGTNPADPASGMSLSERIQTTLFAENTEACGVPIHD